MYTVTLDNNTLYDPRIDELKIFNTDLTLEAGKVGGFDFTIYPQHPLYSRIKRFKSVIEVYSGQRLLFRGRVLNDERGIYNEKQIICEGDLAFFNDTIIRPYDFQGSPVEFLTFVLDQHNAQVESEKQFQIGEVTVTDPNDYIARSSINSDKSWNVLDDKLVKLLGGYLFVRRVDGINYVDYLAESTKLSGQTIEIGKNMLDLSEKIKGEEIATAIIPYGAKVKDENDEETDERVTIEAINDGVDYVFNQEAVDKYGWIVTSETWENVNEPLILKQRAEQRLGELVNLSGTITLDAFDLSHLDKTVDDFSIFEYVKTVSEYHKLDDTMLVTKISIDLQNPASNKLTLGRDWASFTEQQLETQTTVENLKIDVEKNQSETVGRINETLTTYNGNIEATAQELKTEFEREFVSVTDYETYKEAVSSEMLQTADGWSFNFTELQQLITDLNDVTETEFSEIKKYIRFVNGDIILGEVNNAFQLQLSKDRISFLNDNVEVAYFSNQKLYVTDAQFLSTLQLGNYSFIPRPNGNLSFKWVGE